MTLSFPCFMSKVFQSLYKPRNLFKLNFFSTSNFNQNTNWKMTFQELPAAADRFSSTTKDVWSLINETAHEAEVETGKPVVNLGQGFFSYSPPDFAIKAAKAALDIPSCNQYSHTKGRPSLLKALSDAYSPLFGRKIDISEILVTAGANEGMYAAFTAFLNPGDEVIVFEPFFDQYISNIELPGGKVVYVPLLPPSDFNVRTVKGSEWKIDFNVLENAITPKTKMIVLNTPHNPVGKVFTKDELLKIGDLAIKNNILILSDEVYERLFYTPFTRIATLSPELERLTITVGSAGKTFAATGWRVGWLIGHPDLIKYAGLAHTRICFTTNSPLSEATATALNEAAHNSYYDDTVVAFKKKYKILNKVWEELNLPYTIAEGGYFVLVNFAKVKIPEGYKFPESIKGRARDFQLAYWLIREIGVVAIPPTEFYIPEHEHIAQDCLRFAVCKDDSMLEEAAVKLLELKKYIKN